MSSIKNFADITKNSDEEKNKVEKATLYLIGTPIGNLGDISHRALKILSEVDFVAAEDTRNSGKLLSYFGIKKPMVSYFEHNKRERGEIICAKISEGESCALITDAGMPAISDPGEDLVKLCAEKNIPVKIVPGPCACVSALALSGLDTTRFAFEGFLSATKSERYIRLEEIKDEKRTLIFYAAPHKLQELLNDFAKFFGDRRIALCRELTKINEEVIRTTVFGAVEYYKENAPRGEYVLVLEGIRDDRRDHFWDNMSVVEHVDHYIENEKCAKMDAIKKAAHDRNISKSKIYNEYIKMTEDKE